MLNEGLSYGKPDILNTDQGSQFTCAAWVELVEQNNIKLSMNGRGRCIDNIFIERLWRTIKYEHIFLHSFETVHEAKQSIGQFIDMYNNKRLHQSLGYKTPAELYNERN
jgi:putative transposase